MEYNMAQPQMVVRHPERGKAHIRTTDFYTSTLWPNETVCGRPSRNMTERVLLGQTDPADRCAHCMHKAKVS